MNFQGKVDFTLQKDDVTAFKSALNFLEIPFDERAIGNNTRKVIISCEVISVENLLHIGYYAGIEAARIVADNYKMANIFSLPRIKP